MTKTVIWDTEMFTNSNLNESDWYTNAQGGGVLLNDSVAGTPFSVILVGGYHPAGGWDSDWYALTPQKTGEVMLIRGSDTIARPYIDILQTPTGSGTVIAGISQNQTTTATFNVTSGVPFYIRTGSDANSAGNYTVNLRFTTATATTEADPTIYDVESQFGQWSGGNLSNNTTSTAQGVVSLGNYNDSTQPLTISGDAHTAGGEDWYVFTAENAGDYKAIRTSATNPATPGSTIEIRDGSTGQNLRTTVSATLNSAATFTLTANQLVYLKVTGTTAAYNGYTVQLRKKAGTTPTPTPTPTYQDSLRSGIYISRTFWVPELESGGPGQGTTRSTYYDSSNNWVYNPFNNINQQTLTNLAGINGQGVKHVRLQVGPEFLLTEVAKPTDLDARDNLIRVVNQIPASSRPQQANSNKVRPAQVKPMYSMKNGIVGKSTPKSIKKSLISGTA